MSRERVDGLNTNSPFGKYAAENGAEFPGDNATWEQESLRVALFVEQHK